MTAAIELPLVLKSSSTNATSAKASTERLAYPRRSAMMIDCSPDSVLHEMLAYCTLEELLTLEEVDKQWANVIAANGTWKEIVLRHEHDAVQLQLTLQQVAVRHGSDVRTLQVINCAISDDLLVEIGRYFTDLRVLVLSGCKALADTGFVSVVEASRKSLIEVRAVRCPMLTDASLEVLGKQHGAALESVDFSHCRFVSSSGVTALVSSTHWLRKVGLKGCPKVNDSAVTAIAANCPQLRSLVLGGSGNVTDAALQSIATNCAGMEVLDIARSNPFGMSRGGVSDDGLLALLSSCLSLKQLILRGQGQLTARSLSALPRFCPQLQALDIGGCRGIVQDPLALCALLRRVSCLEHLSVSFCGGVVEDQHLSSIVSECRSLKRFDVDGEMIVPVASA